MEYSTFWGSVYYTNKLVIGLADDSMFGDIDTTIRSWFRWFLILAALLIVIYLLNMLIAIMSDT